jgi:hypothetical protein
MNQYTEHTTHWQVILCISGLLPLGGNGKMIAMMRTSLGTPLLKYCLKLRYSNYLARADERKRPLVAEDDDTAMDV